MIQCDPRAFAKCPTRHLCGGSARDACFAEGSECDKFNQQVLTQPMSNADRFLSMTDEDMLAFAKKQIGCGFDFFPCGIVCDGKCESFDDETCRAKILKWWHQPAKEGWP